MTKTAHTPGRGGPRPGAGRPKKEPTVRIRVPVSMVDRVKAFMASLQKPS